MSASAQLQTFGALLNGRVDQLSLRFEPEDEWHGKLTASVSASGFAGHGGAWFSTDELRRFALAVSAFPLREGDLPSIAGGFSDKSSGFDQTHVAIDMAPHSSRGIIRVTAYLATEVWPNDASDLSSSVTVRFLVTYGDLGAFAPILADLIEGRCEDAVLLASAD